MVLTFLRWSLPPVRDNEAAAAYLNEAQVHRVGTWSGAPFDRYSGERRGFALELTPSPVTSLFDGRATTRANVAHFMVELMRDGGLWDRWKFKMPVIMNVQNEQ